MQAIILAGGLGKRLSSVVPDLPKPMADVGGRPFLDYLLRQLAANGFDDIVLATGHKGHTIEEYFGTGAARDLRLTYSRESHPMGTGGALKQAARHLVGERFLVMNGDSLFDIPLQELVMHHLRLGAAVTLALTRQREAGRFGLVDRAADGKLVQFIEKPTLGGGGLVNGGVYVMDRAVIEAIPADTPVSLEGEIFPGLIGRGLYGVTFDGAFVDIGVPSDYEGLRAAPERLRDALA